MWNTLLDKLFLGITLITLRLGSIWKDRKENQRNAKIQNIYAAPPRSKSELVERMRRKIVERSK